MDMLGAGAWLLWAAVLSFFDLRYRRLPDLLTLPAAVIACIWWWDFAGLLWPALYFVLGIRKGGIGGGDIKLAISLGMWTAHAAGTWGVLLAIIAASWITLLVDIASRLANRGKQPKKPEANLAAQPSWPEAGQPQTETSQSEAKPLSLGERTAPHGPPMLLATALVWVFASGGAELFS